jgi:hypothetical protein
MGDIEMVRSTFEPLGLVGRCFHTFRDGGYVDEQGIVRGDLGGGYFLVQYFEWLSGSPSTLAITHVSDMKPGRDPGCWQFYLNEEHMKRWYEDRRNGGPDLFASATPHHADGASVCKLI